MWYGIVGLIFIVLGFIIGYCSGYIVGYNKKKEKKSMKKMLCIVLMCVMMMFSCVKVSGDVETIEHEGHSYFANPNGHGGYIYTHRGDCSNESHQCNCKCGGE